MTRAHQARDWELAVGSGKELVEAVAKMVLDARGEPFGNATDFPALINAAHRALARQPGHGLASDPPVREMAQAAKSAVLAVGELRNTHGTGHGRVRAPDVVTEHAYVTADASLLWVRWALRRLDVIVNGRVSDIVRDLRVDSFRRGDLARRLEAADLGSLEETEQHRLGVAVGQRAARATINVLEDGVIAPAVARLPIPYRSGVVEGAFISSDGYLQSTLPLIRGALALLRGLREADAEATVERVLESAREADISYAFDADSRHAVTQDLMSEAVHFSAPIRDGLRWLSDWIDPPLSPPVGV